MASVNKMSKKPISERISMFESPTGSSNAASTPSSSAKNSSSASPHKPAIIKTLSKTNIGALKSQFDSGGSKSSQSQIFSKVSETKSIVSVASPSQSQQSSEASSLASTPAPTPTPPPHNPATSSKPQLEATNSGDSTNAQKERRKLPATPKPSGTSSSSTSPIKPALKSSGSGGRSAVVASAKQACAGASSTTGKTPVSRTPVSGSKSAHREHIPLHKKSSPNSGTSTTHPFGGVVKQRSPTAPIPASHAAKKLNHSSHSTDKINNNNNNSHSTERQIPQGGNTSNINANKNTKSSSPPNQGPSSINRVKAPVTKTLSSPLTYPKFQTSNHATINVNNNDDEDDNNILSDEKTERLHSTTIQTTTSTIKTNQGSFIESVTKQQNIEVKKVNNSNTFHQQEFTNQVLTGKNENRKNSDEHIIDGEKSMSSSSESSSSASPPSASPPPPPMIVPTVTVTLEPNNLNNKNSITKSPLSGDDEVDTTVANNNFKNIVSMQTANMNSNSTITGGRNQQYWTNQALQNDNSKTINEAMKLDLDFKEEKIGALNQELEELSAGGGASEEEVSSLKRQKHDLEMRLKDQEEELDDLAGQVQIFEAAKTKLEMSMAAQKKEHRRELSAKDDELEDARTSTQKKVKVLEQQLESEHEERINFMREKHELETKIINLQELANRSADEEQVAKLKKDLKRTKALLKDAQLMIEKSRNESSNKVVLRQLKNQLEDTEFARMAAVKAKQNVELEVADLQLQLDDVCRNKSDLEDKMLKINREKADMSSQLEDNEEEMSDVMKKYKASVSQLSVDQITIQQQASQVTDLEEERNKLKEQLAEFAQKIESLEGDNVSTAQHQRLELKIKELESKLELEKTTRGRMETQITRLKEGIEKINHECDSLRVKEATSQDQARRLQRQLRDLKENYTTLQQKETEVNAKKNEYEKKLELAEAETVTARNDLKLALKRVEDLQQAINGELDSDLDSLNSDADSDSSDELIGATFMDHHNRAISVQRERESIARDISARESIQREVRASIARDSVVRQLQTMPEEPDLKMSELMSNKRINEGDNDSSSEEDNEDNNTTQQREDSVQQNSIDGTIEESQA